MILHLGKSFSMPIVLTFLFAGLLFGQTPAGTAGKIDDYLRDAVPFGFSGQIVIEKEGQIIFSKAYGFADRHNRVEMTKETLIGIASMSKQFLATAMLKLQEESKLSFNDPMSKFFPEVPEEKTGITIHQLLTHTSGLQRSKNSDFELAGKEEMLEDIFSTPLAFEPGSDWRYSVGYSIAAMIIEKVTGLSYKEYMSEHLFKVASLKYTVHETGPFPESSTIAHSYVGWKDNKTPRQWPVNWRNYGAGDFLSTAEDLQRWISALEAGKILSSESLKQLWSPQSQLEDRPVYGYGWFIHLNPGDTVIEHGGDAALGYNGGIFIYKNKKMKIFITANARTPSGQYIRHAVTQDIEKIVLGEGEEVSSRPQGRLASLDQLNRLTGTFKMNGDGKLHMINDGVYLWVAADGQEAVNLLIQPSTDGKEHFERANDKTWTLLKALMSKHPNAYEKALTEDRIQYLEDYEEEWHRLTNTLGPLHRFEIRGATQFYDNVESIAKLYFRDGSVEMAFLWSDHAEGPLVGTAKFDRINYPVVYPVAMAKEGELIVHDLFNKSSLKFFIEEQNGGHEFKLLSKDQGALTSLTRKGLAGWGIN